MKTICLNMIVKNESKIIERALASVKHLIDYWVICDTGSTDNTPEVIQNYFAANGIPGELHRVEWVNFGHNRSEAIRLAGTKADYLLFIDADMEMVDLGFDKNKLVHMEYMLRQRNRTLSYYNTRLVSTELDWKSIGVTHEHYSPLNRGDVSRHPIESLSFIDHTDGGCKADKFTRDIALLTQGLVDEPDNTRYKFYLANSFKAVGDYKNAIVWFDNRINSGGWEEEVYQSKYTKMLCQIALSCRFEEWLLTGLDAFSFRPNRLEALYEIIKYCRQNGLYRLGYQLGKHQESLPFPQDILFVDQPIHDWQFLDELSICAYWAGDKATSFRITNKILSDNKCPQSEHDRILKNKLFSS